MRCYLFLLVVSSVFAKEYFVAPNGNDAAPGSRSAPYASIQHGLGQLGPGDTLSIASGTYIQSSTPSIWRGGTPERPILIRGIGTPPPVVDASGHTNQWPHGFEIGAPHIRLENIQVRNSKFAGISVWKTHNVTISRCVVSGSWATGIGIQSDTLGGTRAVVVQECVVYDNVLMNASRTMNGGWGSGIGVGHSRSVVLRNNLVYENYGEGLLAYLSDTITISGNTSRDNFSVSLYIDNATEALVEKNFAYSTGKQNYYRFNRPAAGFQIANESEGYKFSNPSRNVTAQNNLFVNQRSALYYGNYQGGGGLKNFRFRYNTAWNSWVTSVHIDQDAHEDVVIEGNLFVQTDDRAHVSYNDSPDLITARRNLYYGGKGPYFAGEGNVFSDPILPGGGTFTAQGYVPPHNSPAAKAGGYSEGVIVDFFGNPRSSPFDIGAFASAATGIFERPAFHTEKREIVIIHASGKLQVKLPAEMGFPITVALADLKGRILYRGIAEGTVLLLPQTGSGAAAILTLRDRNGRTDRIRVRL